MIEISAEHLQQMLDIHSQFDRSKRPNIMFERQYDERKYIIIVTDHDGKVSRFWIYEDVLLQQRLIYFLRESAL